MKKWAILVAAFVLVLAVTPSVAAGNKCTTIQDGTLLNKNGDIITTGYDEWGYNYQAHMFNGWYWNYSRPDVPWTKETLEAAGMSTTWLVMKWNDAWLSNKDCDEDGLLDRHYGYTSYIGSGAWETNHQFGEYEGEDGKTCKWNYFVKIVSPPEDAYKVPANADGSTIPGMWYTADGVEIGTVLWGQHARILQIYNDPCGGFHGIEYLSPAGPGFGYYK